MESKEDSCECENTSYPDEESTDNHTDVSDEQEMETQPSRLCLRPKPTSSQLRRMRRKALVENKMQETCSLRRGRSARATPMEVLEEIAADENIDERLSGWKLTLATNQMDAISDIETQNIEMLTGIIRRNIGDAADGPVNKANRRRCLYVIEKSKQVREEMQKTKLRLMKLFGHIERVTGIIRNVIEDKKAQGNEK